MKNFTGKIAATALATGLLMTGAVTAAVAEGDSPPAVQQQSNITPDDSHLTFEAMIIPGGVQLLETPGGEWKGAIVKNRSDYGEKPIPLDISPVVLAPDGSAWRLTSVSHGDVLSQTFGYIPESSLAGPVAKRGTAAALAEAETQARYDKNESLYDGFTGTGTVNGGASWYESEELTGEAAGVVTGLGYQNAMSPAVTNSAGVSVHRFFMSTGLAGDVPVAAYVAAEFVTDFTADAPEPSPTPTPTYGATAGPNQPGNQPQAPEVPTEENEASPSADATAGSGWKGDSLDGVNAGDTKKDDPGNIFPLVGGGLAVAGLAGAWLYWTNRKKGAGAENAGEEVSAGADTE